MASDTPPPSKESIIVFVNRLRMLAGVTVMAFVTLGYKFLPLPIPPLPSTVDRLAFTLRWQVLPLTALLAGFLNVIYNRQTSRAGNPLSGKDEHIVKLPLQFLQNTLEQLVFHMLVQLMLTTYLDAEHMKVIPLMAMVFVIGRIAFWVGYQSDTHHFRAKRVYGFGINFFTNIFVWAYCLAALVLDLVGIQIYW